MFQIAVAADGVEGAGDALVGGVGLTTMQWA